jgi:hypothetical protein
MQPDRIEAITALLAATGAAHGTYEEAELNGVYDKDWPAWYAAYAVEHGLPELVGHEVTADRLASFLSSTYADFEQLEPRPSEPWPAWTARRIAEEL